MRKIVRLSNSIFIIGLLTVFYFVVIGFSYLLLKTWEFIKRGGRRLPQWEDMDFDAKKEDLTSPY